PGPCLLSAIPASLVASSPELPAVDPERWCVFWNTQSARRIVVAGVDSHALPAALQGYFPAARR
ncbi:MAG: hypothetical protein ACMG6S_14055, partial [Byssovorax sp.]